jgi:hypothetical protein
VHKLQSSKCIVQQSSKFQVYILGKLVFKPLVEGSLGETVKDPSGVLSVDAVVTCAAAGVTCAAAGVTCAAAGVTCAAAGVAGAELKRPAAFNSSV